MKTISSIVFSILLSGTALTAAHSQAVPVTDFTEAEVRNADEVWLSSSTKEVLPVTLLDGKPVGHGDAAGKPGPMLAKMRAAYQAAKAAL